MDGELPPPFPGSFEHDLDTSRTHGEDEEHEVFGHIPLPEIEHAYIPDHAQLVKAASSSKNGMIPTVFPETVDNSCSSMEQSAKPKTSTDLPTTSDTTDTQNVAIEPLANGSHTPSLPQYHTTILFNSCNEDSSEVFTEYPEQILPKDDIEQASNSSVVRCELPRLEPDPPRAPTADNCDEDDDEFGDFAETSSEPIISSQASPLAAPSKSEVHQKEEELEWGDFDQIPRRDSHLASAPSIDEDDDFGAFGSATTAAEPTVVETESWTPQFTESPREIDSENWEEGLLQGIVDVEWEYEETEVAFDEDNVSEVSAVLNAPNKSIGEDCPLKQVFELWCLLRIVEEAKSLQYVFDGSTLASNHYKKINIDKTLPAKGILSPLSSEAVLTPTPVNGSMASHAVTEILKPTTTISEQAASPPSMSVPFDSLSAPPAEFDWDKSGLTNPLKGTKGASALLDVDFLSANSGGSSSGTFTLQKDLEAFGLDMGVNINAKTSEKSILDTILLSASPQSSYKPVAELSLDARALHDQLPDLSCLLSRKVMLPFGGQNL